MHTQSLPIRWMLLALLPTMLLAACGQRTDLLLLPNPDGSVGQLVIANRAGSQRLETAGTAVTVKGPEQAPEAPRAMSPAEIDTLFGAALQAMPQAPEQFVFYFISGTTELSAESLQQLPAIVEAIQRRPAPEIGIVGHTDRVGAAQDNYQLALKRAEMLRVILIENGIAPALIRVESHGEANPLVSTLDEVAESRNRRVEVIVR